MIDLRQGDCLEVMKQIPTGSVDAIIADPPYGTTQCKWDTIIDFDLMWKELNRIIKPNGAIVLFGSEPFSSALRMSNIKNYKYDWIWNKKKAGNFRAVKSMPLIDYEKISVFNHNKSNYKPQMTIGKERKKGGYHSKYEQALNNGTKVKFNNLYYPKGIIEFSKANNIDSKLHPTQKPIALMEYLIKTYTNENETILDFTMGSGSTMVACQNTNRNGIGIEQDEKYFKIAQDRIKENEYKLF